MGKLRISALPESWILAALLLLMLPLKWLAAGFFAAAFHECCHYLTILLTGGQVHSIEIGPLGTKMDTAPMLPKTELICALAGPAGSFALFSLYRFFPLTALCALVQGIFNLLPLYPMDGGRVVYCLASMLLPEEKTVVLLRVLKMVTCFFILLFSLWGTFRWMLGLAPLVWGSLLLVKLCLRKKTLHCRPSQGTIELPLITR